MYEREYKIENFYCDQAGILKVPYLMHFLNDIMERNANSYKAGASYHLSKNLAWVLVEYQLDIHRWPHKKVAMMVGTIPYSFKRMFGYRQYRLRDKSNRVFVEGKGKFALIDIKKKMFVRPEREILERFIDAKKDPVALKFDSWPVSKKVFIDSKNTFVSHDHIDVNGHVNNAYFPTFAYQALPRECFDQETITQLYVKYKKEAFLHEILILKTYKVIQGYQVDIYRNEEILGNVFFKTKTLDK